MNQNSQRNTFRRCIPEIHVVLHNVRSVHNVGSLFRTADAAGVVCVYLVGYTPAPYDRFGRTRTAMQKTALGATDSVPWRQAASITAVYEAFTAQGIVIHAVEQAAGAIRYDEASVPAKVAYVFGNEREGLDADARACADRTLYIPQYGAKESLNVTVAAGVVLFAARHASGFATLSQ